MDNKLWLIFVMLGLGGYFLIAAGVVKTFRYKYGNIPIPKPLGRAICIILAIFCYAIAFRLAWTA